MTLWRIIAGGAALALLMLPGGPGFSFAAGSSFEAALLAARGESPRTISAIVKQNRYGPTAVPAVAWASRGRRYAAVLP